MKILVYKIHNSTREFHLYSKRWSPYTSGRSISHSDGNWLVSLIYASLSWLLLRIRVSNLNTDTGAYAGFSKRISTRAWMYQYTLHGARNGSGYFGISFLGARFYLPEIKSGSNFMGTSAWNCSRVLNVFTEASLL